MIRSMKTRVAAVLAAAGIALAATGCASEPAPVETSNTGDTALDTLIEEARAEGEVTVYFVPDERVAQQLQVAFKDEYGVELKYMRATAAEIAQRLAAEADAGATVAGGVVTLNDGFLADQLEQDRLVPIEDADIPGFPGELADAALLDGLAVVQLTRLGIGYNTDIVAEGTIKGWEDLLKPEFEGRIAISSPDNTIHNDLFYVLSEEYGMEFLEKLAPQINRVYTGGAQVVEALSSTEAHAAPGVVAAGLAIGKSQGAPLGWFIPENTILSPSVMGIAANAPNPAAARLLAYYLMSPAGLELLNGAEGQVSPTDAKAFEAGWLASPELDATAAAVRDKIKAALGVQ